MWLFVVAGLPLLSILVYFAMKNGLLTFGISGLKQRRDHGQKEWKTEKAVVPIESKGIRFEIKTDVKWCPDTSEIFYRVPEDTSMFQKQWKEISEYSDLYDRLLQNFRQKYILNANRNSNRTNWIKISKQ
jgi:hypothetical protein